MFRSTRSRLVGSFLGVSLLVGAVSLLVGGQLLYKAVLNEAKTRVRLDLNAAREIYSARSRNISLAVNVTALGPGFQSAVREYDCAQITQRLIRVADWAGFDFAGIAAPDGTTICHLGSRPDVAAGGPNANPLVVAALQRRAPVAGTVILDADSLRRENADLADRARIKIVPTPHAAPHSPQNEERAGMCIGAASPVYADGELVGVFYAGCLLNHSQAIVDTIRATVFQQETWRGLPVGTATIFFGDLRIATNVEDPDGQRAIGTRVSQEVRDTVLRNGRNWLGRAFVVNDWNLTAYEPIEDIAGRTVGMLCVGVLEARYTAVRWMFFGVFVLITLTGMVVAGGAGYVLANRILSPMQRLIAASEEVAKGNLDPDIGPITGDEVGVLQRTFKDMLASIADQEQRMRAASETKLMQSEKQASIGRLAAGVAHEINNPLTGVLIFTHMLLRRKDLEPAVRSDLEVIARETERVRKIVRGLLDFSRQIGLAAEPTNVNTLVATTLALVENQALIKDVTLEFKPDETLPLRELDRDQMQSALLNIVMNAIDATPPGGRIMVATSLARTQPQDAIEISVTDTGCGIPPSHLNKLFDPFFTTKEVGQGTGLGLSVALGIVEHHGGAIAVSSTVGRGSVFTIRLPLEVPHADRQAVDC